MATFHCRQLDPTLYCLSICWRLHKLPLHGTCVSSSPRDMSGRCEPARPVKIISLARVAMLRSMLTDRERCSSISSRVRRFGLQQQHQMRFAKMTEMMIMTSKAVPSGSSWSLFPHAVPLPKLLLPIAEQFAKLPLPTLERLLKMLEFIVYNSLERVISVGCNLCGTKGIFMLFAVLSESVDCYPIAFCRQDD